MAGAPSNTVWGSVSSNGKGKLGLAITESISNTQVVLTVEVWLALKYNISDTNNSFYFSYTNDSGSTVTNPNGTSLSLKFGITTGSGWSTSSQQKLGTYTLTYTRGTAAKTVYISSKLLNLAGDNYSVSVSKSYTVPAKPSYTVAYNANGGSGAPGSQTKWYGSTLTLSTTRPTRTGYSFLGWGTTASDSSVDYSPGGSYTANANITLYAIWKANTYTVAYNANGGSGAPASQTKTYGVDLTLSSTKPTRTNYTFMGWGISATATSVAYTAGGKYTSNANITLYAIWVLAYVKPIVENVSVYRCDSSGNASDEGGYFNAIFSWSTFNTISSITVEWKLKTETSYSNSTTISASGTSGSVITGALGSGDVSIEYSYDIRIVVSDSGGSTPVYKSISSMKIPVDFRKGGIGLGVGKTAETDYLLEVAWDAKFYGTITIGDRQYGTNKVLWSGAWSMEASHTVTLSEAISAQPHGVVLVWSYYDGSAAQNYSYSAFFIPKYFNWNGGVYNSTIGVSYHMAKYLYISDTAITGYSTNSKDATINGVTYHNTKYVLRYVIGV